MAGNGAKSKKRSAASWKSRPPERLIFFLDRSLGKKKIAAALREAGAEVMVHDDHFPPDARDEHWLKEAGARGWIVLTKDRRIRYRTIEREALIKARVRAFVLTAGDLQGAEMAQIFVKALPAIRRFSIKAAPPFVAKVSRAGVVSMLFTGS